MDTPHRHHLPTPKKKTIVLCNYIRVPEHGEVSETERDERSRLDVMFL